MSLSFLGPLWTNWKDWDVSEEPECTDGWNTGLVLPVMGRRSIVSPVILKPGYIRIIQRGIFLQYSANLHSQSFLFIWPGVGPEHWHFPRFLW